MVLQLANKRSFSLIDFFSGTSGQDHFGITDSASEKWVNGLQYRSEPSISIEEEKRSGALRDQDIRLRVRGDGPNAEIRAFLARLSNGEPYKRTRLRVIEVLNAFDPALPTEYRYTFAGVLSRATKNVSGEPNMVQLRGSWSKSLMDKAKLGTPATTECNQTYGGQGCGVPITPYVSGSNPNARESHRVRGSFISGTRISLTPDSGLPSEIDAINPSTGRDKWSRGYLEDDEGLRLNIREYRPFSLNFILERRAPASWDFTTSGKVLTLYPGCMKNPSACAIRLNTNNFNGLGWGTPAYNPLVDAVLR